MIERSIRPLRKALALLLSLLLSAVSLAAQKQPTAQEILKQAQSQAAVQHKLVFLILGASWCGPCHRLDRLLAASDVQPIIAKYFVVAKINVLEENGKHPELNTPGGNDLWEKLANHHGVPYIVFEDSEGKMLVTSDRPVAGKSHGANIGYPDSPEEIDWFLSMLKTSLPALTSEESSTIDSWLRKNSRK
jgi:thioredoxin-related protein